MNNQNLTYQIALTLAKGVGDITAKQLLQAVDNDIERLFKENPRALQRVYGISSRIATSLQDADIRKRAEQEISFIEKKQIKAIFIEDDDYPQRLKNCIDSPILLFYKGNANLNATKTISIVGTRHATEMGRNIVDNIVKDLSLHYPNLLVVSGLAYGIDIIAHKAALHNGLNTVGVLAHGLDRIYPGQHRSTAVEMIGQGGLLTDFISGTNPDRQNFVMRNRIVAGMADCTLVVESAAKGGALITADIAFGYSRDVLAVPGRTTDTYSQGCNKIIKENKAALVENAEDIIRAMCWSDNSILQKKKPVQKQLFLDLTEQEQIVYDLLSEQAMQLNQLGMECNMPINRLTTLLFEMEMKDIVKCLPGGVYQIRN